MDQRGSAREKALAAVVVAISLGLLAYATLLAWLNSLAQAGAAYIISPNDSVVYFYPKAYVDKVVNATTDVALYCELESNQTGLELIVIPASQLSNFSDGLPYKPIVEVGPAERINVTGNVTLGPGEYAFIVYNDQPTEAVVTVVTYCEVRAAV